MGTLSKLRRMVLRENVQPFTWKYVPPPPGGFFCACSVLGRHRYRSCQPQLTASKPALAKEVGSRTLARPPEKTENREASAGAKTQGLEGWRSRGNDPEPRQHWRSRQKKSQPIRVGILINGGNSEYELTSISFNPARRFKLLHVIFCRCRHLPQGAQSPQVGGSETGPRVQACRPCFPRSDAG